MVRPFKILKSVETKLDLPQDIGGLVTNVRHIRGTLNTLGGAPDYMERPWCLAWS
jgi:hypothetical protein